MSNLALPRSAIDPMAAFNAFTFPRFRHLSSFTLVPAVQVKGKRGAFAELVTTPSFMTNYTFTSVPDKLPRRWSNFTTGEGRLVTVLRGRLQSPGSRFFIFNFYPPTSIHHFFLPSSRSFLIPPIQPNSRSLDPIAEVARVTKTSAPPKPIPCFAQKAIFQRAGP